MSTFETSDENFDSKTYKVIKKSFIQSSLSTLKKKPDKNVKRMLCRNVIKGGICGYGTKCKYSHTLSEQVIDLPRKHAWEILLSNNTLENTDLQKNYQLYQSLDELTKSCKQCCNNECIGGYNCDHGVFDKKYQICQQDLDYGMCKNSLCNLVHLTERGLKPWYNKQKINVPVTSPSTQKIKGTLLSEKFFNNINFINNQDEETLSNFTNSSDEYESYEDECNKSIFTK